MTVWDDPRHGPQAFTLAVEADLILAQARLAAQGRLAEQDGTPVQCPHCGATWKRRAALAGLICQPCRDRQTMERRRRDNARKVAKRDKRRKARASSPASASASS